MLPRAIKHQLTCPIELISGSFLIGRRGILVILRNRLEWTFTFMLFVRGMRPFTLILCSLFIFDLIILQVDKVDKVAALLSARKSLPLISPSPVKAPFTQCWIHLELVPKEFWSAYMRQTMLTQSGAPGRVIGWINLSHWHSMNGFRRNFQCLTGFVHYLFCSF